MTDRHKINLDYGTLGLLIAGIALFIFSVLRADFPPSSSFKPPPITAAEPALFQWRIVSDRAGNFSQPSITERDNGSLFAVWRVLSNDRTDILGDHFDATRQVWGADISITAKTVQHEIANHLSEPTPIAVDDELWLVYSAAFSPQLAAHGLKQIQLLRSQDSGLSWQAGKRIMQSPFRGYNSTIGGTSFRYADGSIGLPISTHAPATFNEILRLDSRARTIAKTRINYGMSVIPAQLIVQDGQRASAALGSLVGSKPERALIETRDGGRSWQAPRALTLPGKGGKLASSGTSQELVVVWNNSDYTTAKLAVALSKNRGKNWSEPIQLGDFLASDKALGAEKSVTRAIFISALQARLEQLGAPRTPAILKRALEANCKKDKCLPGYKDPALLRAQDGRYHLLYVWHQAAIAHLMFNRAWLDSQ